MKIIGHYAWTDPDTPVGGTVTTLCGKTSRRRSPEKPALVTCTTCAEAVAQKERDRRSGRVVAYRWQSATVRPTP